MQYQPVQQVQLGGYVPGKGYLEQSAPVTTMGSSVVMPATTYAQPMAYQPAATTMTYGGSTVMAAPMTTYAAPMAATAVDVNRDGRADYVVTGTDFNRDGIPDAMEQPVTTTYVTQAPAATTSYVTPTYAAAAPTYTTTALPTTASMVAYPQTQGPFVFYPANQAPSAPAAEPAKRDVAVAKKKKKTGSCACCCPAKKAAAKKK